MQDSSIMDNIGNPPGDTRWDALIEWARLFYQWEGFQDAERSYKLEISQTLAGVRDMLLDGFPNWDAGLKGPRSPGYHLVNWRVYSAFRNLLEKDREMVGDVLRQFWRAAGAVPPEDRVRQFEERISVGPSGQLSAAFLLADDPADNPPYRSEYLNKAYQLVGREREEVGDDGGRRYRRMLDFLDEFVRRSEMRGLPVRDRLDAQSLVWCVMVYGLERPPASDWSEAVRQRYEAYLNGESLRPPPPPPEPEPEPEPDAPPPPDPWSDGEHRRTGRRAALGRRRAGRGGSRPAGEEAGDLLRASWNGKDLRGPPDRPAVPNRRGRFQHRAVPPVLFVRRLHRGFRPRLHGGQPGFELIPGPLRRIAAQAAANPRSAYILVIDELNRGNVSKVFGELYFLLEYRDEEVQLQYGGPGQQFRLPENLWFICTMNTADRSIALMDAALRRRFYFAPFFSDRPPCPGFVEEMAGPEQPADALAGRPGRLRQRQIGRPAPGRWAELLHEQ